MGVVRGDRIRESQKLNQVSLEAFFAYALFVDVLPDDFGRFRCNSKLAAGHLAPRREDVTADVVARIFDEYERAGLIRAWEVDGARFAEFTGFRPRGNRYHRTPEPPWSDHEHRGRCLATAIHRAREWGDTASAESLSIRMKQLRDREPTGSRPGAGIAPGSATFSPTPPFPSVPLRSPPTETTDTTDQQSVAPVLTAEPPTPRGGRREIGVPKPPSVTAARFAQVFNGAFNRAVGLTPNICRRVDDRLRAGYKPWQILALPILVASRPLEVGLERHLTPEVLLRDGKHPRTTKAGYTAGATDWLERELQQLDRVELDERLAAIASEAGVLEPLMQMGVSVRKASGL